MHFLIKLHIYLTCLSSFLPKHLLKRNKNTCTRIFIAALFKLGKTCKYLVSIQKRMESKLCIHTTQISKGRKLINK